MTVLPDVLTPLPVESLLVALAGGYRKTMGDAVGKAACLAALGAQLCLESGNGQKAHCFNWGNRKRKDGDEFTVGFRCDEIFDEATAHRAQKLGRCMLSPWRGGPLYRVVLEADHPWAQFAAFTSAEDGCADYITLLSCNDRYRKAWHAAYSGDPVAFSHALHAAGYYTADETVYTRGLVSIAARILPACERIVAGEAHGLTDEDREHIDELVALTTAEAAARAFHPEEFPLRDTDPSPPEVA